MSPGAGRRPLNADERALLDRLVRECGPRLLAYVRHVYRGRLDAEEIVAESFCRAAANIEAVRRSERPDLYLLTVARNLCRDWLRRRGESPLASDAGATLPSRDPLPGSAASAEERRRALLDALDALPESQREVVALRLSTDLKFEEIAELLHVPLGTVLWRMHAAVGRLRAQLESSE